MSRYHQELQTALDAARAAGEIQLAFRSNPEGIRRKDDRSPVTDIDIKCEQIVRDKLLSSFPGDGFLGEESGAHNGPSGRQWIVDPLDGTRPFIRGIPTHSVLIALEEDGRPVVGVCHLPAMQETYYASFGSGACCNGNPVHVSATDNLASSMGSMLGYVQKHGTEEADALMRIMRQCDYIYGFMDVYSYGCVASGKLDLCVNLLDKAWDCAAAACIVKEAGGRYSDIRGNENIHNGSIVLTNGILHDTVLSLLCRNGN